MLGTIEQIDNTTIAEAILYEGTAHHDVLAMSVNADIRGAPYIMMLFMFPQRKVLAISKDAPHPL